MPHRATLSADYSTPRADASSVVVALLVVWSALVFGLGATRAFVAPAGAPPLPLLAAVLGPLSAFLLAYWSSAAVRDLVLRADLQLITATQAWRFGGFTFLALYSYGLLPAYFAWPAGLGDMAIGATAPWMLGGLAREPGFAGGRRFATWNVLGIVDLVVAVSTGAVVPLLFPRVANAMPTDAMTTLPMVLIPGLFVPGYLVLHVIALIQGRSAASAMRSR